MASHGLWHPQVDVDYNVETRTKIYAGEYRPTRNDQVLDAMNTISDVCSGRDLPIDTFTFSSVYRERAAAAARLVVTQ
jgi:hypothetical protein